MHILSETVNLVKVRKFIVENALEFGFDIETANEIALAVDEACTNIIRHAYHNAKDKPIEVKLKLNQNKFEICIVDEGDIFNPESIIMPVMEEYIKQLKPGGLGMFLMKQLVDVVQYKIGKNKKNEVKLIKYRNSEKKKYGGKQ